MPPVLTLVFQMIGLAARPALRRTAILTGATLFFVLIGMAGFAVALFIVLARVTDPLVAALILGGVGFMGAGITLLVARAGRRSSLNAKSLPEIEAQLSAMMAREDSGGVWGPLVAAAIAGFLITRQK